ncbi:MULTISPECIES: hypothetical protein [unclassified Methylobacterium]|nr:MULTISPECIES: hypothetical protein [unclassified Methylobacterium]SFU86558.1 hypothetical protein SAMN02799643_02769 [Methylobacterium sp. UNCCL125]
MATCPHTPPARAGEYARLPIRLLDLVGELVSAALIIAGGVFAYGYIPLA